MLIVVLMVLVRGPTTLTVISLLGPLGNKVDGGGEVDGVMVVVRGHDFDSLPHRG